MAILYILSHLFLPSEKNNHKAKILHSSSLVALAILFVFFQLILNFVLQSEPNILGYASSIVPSEVVRLTNIKRAESGVSPLSLNQTLSNAAYTKGKDMIDRDYWAHVAPDGTQPWKFFKDFGYSYRYAGENLARDFSSAEDVVNAWMNSPTHKENMLNPKYKEIGIGVTEGDLSGSDTTIVVQFFGAKYADKVNVPLANSVKIENDAIRIDATPLPTVPRPTSVSEVKSVTSPNIVNKQQVLISPFTTTRNVSLIVVVLLLTIFVIDAMLVSRRKISRIAGRTFSHVIFLLMILTIIMILRSGKII